MYGDASLAEGSLAEIEVAEEVELIIPEVGIATRRLIYVVEIDVITLWTIVAEGDGGGVTPPPPVNPAVGIAYANVDVDYGGIPVEM
jgi:hypothetical protein